MKVKIKGKKTEFDPDAIEWRHQSSPRSHFGIWQMGNQRVFVKRVEGRPDGWPLLRRCRGDRLGNSPLIYDLTEDGVHHYMFLEYLEGDTLHSIFQNAELKPYFGASELSPEARVRIILSLYQTLNSFHSKGFWYPDLDFRNVFISPEKSGFSVFLIDLDSAVRMGQSFSPDHVSQRFWEGMAKSCQESKNPFFIRGSGNSTRLALDGMALNQSMLLLFAHAIWRLGRVPEHLPLFDPLIHENNPHRPTVLRLHQRWLVGENCSRELKQFLSAYLRLESAEFERQLQNCRIEASKGLFRAIFRLFRF